MTRVSVVVPVYNAENYIEKCVHSIIKQTYPIHEVILVDDGSKDNSLSLCLSLKKTDSRVVVIHQENTGVSAARNTGIDAASGDLVYFVDSDDYVEENGLQQLMEHYEKQKSDFVFSGWTTRYDNGKSEKTVKTMPQNGEYTIREFVEKLQEHERYLNGPFSKLYSLNIIKNNEVRFPVGVKIGEDKIFVSNYLLYCSTVSSVQSSAYQYRVAEAGTLSSVKSLSVPKVNYMAAKNKTELKVKNGISCADFEYRKQLYQVLTFNYLRVFSKRQGFDLKMKLDYCCAVENDAEIRSDIKKYKGYDLKSKLIERCINYRMHLVMALFWWIFRQ